MSWALITGASSGIGREYARIFAAQGVPCILVARRADDLNRLADELKARYGVESVVVTLDLSRRENAHALYQLTKEKNLNVTYLINNAGVGIFDYFDQSSLEAQEAQLTLNMITPTILTHLYLQEMRKVNAGYIQFVASIASYLPTPLYATYGATKAYLRHFGVSLNYELKDTDIHVSVINPGVTETEFFKAAGQKNSLLQRAQMMSARACALHGYRALMKNKNSSMAGFLNWFTAHVLTRFLPTRLQAKAIYDDLTRSNVVSRRGK